MAHKDDRSKRVRERDFITNPDPTFLQASREPVVLTDEQDRPAAIISIPRDPRPTRFD